MRHSRPQDCPTNILKGQNPCGRLTGRPPKHDRPHMSGAEWYVHQNKQQRKADSKLHPYAKRGILVGHEHFSPCWCVLLMQKTKLVKSSHTTFEWEAKILDVVRGQKDVELSDDVDELSEKEAAKICSDDKMGWTATRRHEIVKAFLLGQQTYQVQSTDATPWGPQT